MAGPEPPAPHYEHWILETIDSLRSRKARPDLERICRMVRRRHGPEPERTRLELERLVQRRAVLRVSYKGSISYRNAARLQPPRRGKGAAGRQGPGTPLQGAPGTPLQGAPGVQGGGTPAVQGSASPQPGPPGVLEGANPEHGTLELLWGRNPQESEFGVQRGGNVIHGTLGVQDRGPIKAATFGVQAGAGPTVAVGSTEAHFGVQGGGSPQDGTLGVKGGGSLNMSTFGDQGRVRSKEAHFWLQGGGSPQDGTFGVQWGGVPRNAQFGVQGEVSSKSGKPSVPTSPKEPTFVLQGGGSPKDGKLWVQGGVNTKEVKLGVQRGGSPNYGMFLLQGDMNSTDGMFALQAGWSPKDGTFGVQGGGSPKDGTFGVQGAGSPKDLSGMQEGSSPKDGTPVRQEEESPREDMSGVQEKPGVFGEDRLEEATLSGQDRHGVLQETQRMPAEGSLGVLGEQTPGSQPTLGVLESSAKNGSLSPLEGDMATRSTRETGSRPPDTEQAALSVQGSHQVMDTERPGEEEHGCKSPGTGDPRAKAPREDCREVVLNGSPTEAVPGEQQGPPGPPEDGTPRRVKRGTQEQVQAEPPSKRLRTSRPESPEPGGEQSRRGSGAAPPLEVSPASSTRSGSRRSPGSGTAPRVERLTRARGRWQQEEEWDHSRRQRSRSRPGRSAGRPQESPPGSSAQSSRAKRSKKVEEDLTKGQTAEDISMLSEGSEPLDAEETAKTFTGDNNMKSAPTASSDSDLAQVAKTSHQISTDKDSFEKDKMDSEGGLTAEGSSKDGPTVSTDTQPRSPMEKPFNLCAAAHCPPDTSVCSLDKNESMGNTYICPRIKSEKGCNANLFSIARNTNGCNTNIGPLNRSTSVRDTICPRVKREEGCDTSVYPLGECAVKAVLVETVKLEDDAGEPRDCEASLGIEGVEPHLPVRVSPVTPMILSVDRTSYRKISVTKKPSDPVLWTVTDVVQYFTDAGFAEQASAFQEQEIDGRSLLLMQRTDVLTGLSIRLGPALKMYEHHIKILQQCHFAEESDFLG